MITFTYTTTRQHILFGAGALDQLGDVVAELGWRRLLICTIPRLARSGLTGRIAALLGSRLVAIYDEAQPHVPAVQVAAAVAQAQAGAVDAIIGLGGGSPIGLAKAVSWELGEGDVPIIAIPTTYSGSEMTPIFGVTRPRAEGETRKMTVTDRRVTPRLTLYDPEITLDLPPRTTAASGLNALAHCVEAVYADNRTPLTTAAALAGAGHIYRALPRAVAAMRDLAARTELLQGAYLAATAVATANIGLHHGLCHVLGGTAGVPHGIANGIMLPHAMRFNADVAAAELAAVARALNVRGDDEAALAAQAADAVFELTRCLGLPQRLRDVGVAASDLPRLARLALHSKAVQNNPKPVTDAQQAEDVYRAAW